MRLFFLEKCVHHCHFYCFRHSTPLVLLYSCPKHQTYPSLCSSSLFSSSTCLLKFNPIYNSCSLSILSLTPKIYFGLSCHQTLPVLHSKFQFFLLTLFQHWPIHSLFNHFQPTHCRSTATVAVVINPGQTNPASKFCSWLGFDLRRMALLMQPSGFAWTWDVDCGRTRLCPLVVKGHSSKCH